MLLGMFEVVVCWDRRIVCIFSLSVGDGEGDEEVLFPSMSYRLTQCVIVLDVNRVFVTFNFMPSKVSLLTGNYEIIRLFLQV